MMRPATSLPAVARTNWERGFNSSASLAGGVSSLLRQFSCSWFARVIDPNVPIEDVAGAVKDLINEGRSFALPEKGSRGSGRITRIRTKILIRVIREIRGKNFFQI